MNQFYRSTVLVFLALNTMISLKLHAAPTRLQPDEQAFKAKNIASLRGPSDEDAKNKNWEHFVKITIRYEDSEVLKKIFDAQKYVDGASAEIYPNFF
jgi:hypothetical protein